MPDSPRTTQPDAYSASTASGTESARVPHHHAADHGLPGHFAGPAPCPYCGYSLDTMAREGLCPECGERYTYVRADSFPPLPNRLLLAIDIGWPMFGLIGTVAVAALEVTHGFGGRSLTDFLTLPMLIFGICSLSVPIVRMEHRLRIHWPPADWRQGFVHRYFVLGWIPGFLVSLSLLLAAGTVLAVFAALLVAIVL